jgi:hypothetical protein
MAKEQATLLHHTIEDGDARRCFLILEIPRVSDLLLERLAPHPGPLPASGARKVDFIAGLCYISKVCF